MMTREEILSMPAGQELDALVAEHVFGKQVTWTFSDEWTDSYPIDEHETIIDNFSTEIMDAWEVAEALQPQGIYIDIRSCADFYEVQALEYIIDRRTETIADPSVAVGICKAALLSLLKED